MPQHSILIFVFLDMTKILSKVKLELSLVLMLFVFQQPLSLVSNLDLEFSQLSMVRVTVTLLVGV